MSYRFTTLQKQGKARRVARGMFSSNGDTAPAQLTDPNQDLLDHLLKEREQLDVKIETVREVIKMQKSRVAP